MASMSERISYQRYQWKTQWKLHNTGDYATYIKAYIHIDHFPLAGLKLLDMAKDFFDTRRRYKSRHHVWRDAAQAFHGLVNLVIKPFLLVLMAVGSLVSAPFMMLYNSIFGFANPGDPPVKNLKILQFHLYQVAGFLAHAVTALVRGITQLAAAPLTWLRMIARGAYTAIKGWQPFTENIGARDIVNHVTPLIYSNQATSQERPITQGFCLELQSKLKKAVSQGQPIDIDATHEYWGMNAQIEKGNDVFPHRIYVKETGPKSFSYITSRTVDPNDPTGMPKLVEVNLADLMPSFQEDFNLKVAKHAELLWKIVIKNGHIDPADAVIDAKNWLYPYFDEADEADKARAANDPDCDLFSNNGIILAKSYFTLFGATSQNPVSPPQEPRPAYQWDAKRNLQYL